MEKCLVPELGQEKHKANLKHLMVPVNNIVLKNVGDMGAGHGSQLRGASTKHPGAYLSLKIHDSNEL